MFMSFESGLFIFAVITYALVGKYVFIAFTQFLLNMVIEYATTVVIAVHTVKLSYTLVGPFCFVL